MAQSPVTVTPPNPTPPTNVSYVGETPPTTDGLVPENWEDRLTEDPTKFAAPTAGEPHEGAGTEEVYTPEHADEEDPPQPTVSVLGEYTATPNEDHASNINNYGPEATKEEKIDHGVPEAWTHEDATKGTNPNIPPAEPPREQPTPNDTIENRDIAHKGQGTPPTPGERYVPKDQSSAGSPVNDPEADQRQEQDQQQEQDQHDEGEDPDELEEEIDEAEEEGDVERKHRGGQTRTASHKRSKSKR